MSEVDLDYSSYESSITKSSNDEKDVDKNNISILRQHLKDVDELIAKHNTFDVIDLSSKISVENQIIAHRIFVTYMRNFREDLVNKIEELGNG